MLPKFEHEIRDPVHTFIRVSSDERRVIDSRAFQRLRHIHQLALTFLVYPGATHRRFEHCLGVMDLAGRIFDVVTRQPRHPDVQQVFPSDKELDYWRTVVRMGALCHDLGHIPFSHGAEAVLPKGTHHEQLSVDVILSDEMRAIWSTMKPPLEPLDVAKVAVGLKDWPRDPKEFTPWDELLTEVVTGNAFGADRADYLLRDSHHAGVAYGHFDHHRLIDTLRVLRAPGTGKPTIGIERGGMHAAEGMQLARYFMFEQLYYHRVRRALDLHLRDFLRAILPGGVYPTRIDDHLQQTDNEILVAMTGAAKDERHPGSAAARRILQRQFYRVLYEPTQDDLSTNINAVEAVQRAAEAQFGVHMVARDREAKPAKPMDFAVLRDDGQIVSSLQESKVLDHIPAATFDRVFIIPELRGEAERWLAQNLRGILQMRIEEEP
ncbi:MAG: HD domain-containing protein [Acidobacteria bacterium]|nr:HD domain-containing protein [Acidobacteriota bacterium]